MSSPCRLAKSGISVDDRGLQSIELTLAIVALSTCALSVNEPPQAALWLVTEPT